MKRLAIIEKLYVFLQHFEVDKHQTLGDTPEQCTQFKKNIIIIKKRSRKTVKQWHVA